MLSVTVYLVLLALWCQTAQCEKLCDLANEMCVTPQSNISYQKLLHAENLIPTRINETITTETSDYTFELYNTVFYGFENCNVLMYSYDVPNNKLVYVMFCPRSVMTTNHTFTGTIANVTDIDVKGGFTISANKIILILRVKYSVSERDSKKYMTMEELDIGITPVAMFKFEQIVITDGDENEAKGLSTYLNDKGYETTHELGMIWTREGVQTVINGLQRFLTYYPLEGQFAMD